MKKISRKIKKVGKWLSGRKTYLAVLAGLAAQYGAISEKTGSAIVDVLEVLPAMLGEPTTYGLAGLAALRAGVSKGQKRPAALPQWTQTPD